MYYIDDLICILTHRCHVEPCRYARLPVLINSCCRYNAKIAASLERDIWSNSDETYIDDILVGIFRVVVYV